MVRLFKSLSSSIWTCAFTDIVLSQQSQDPFRTFFLKKVFLFCFFLMTAQELFFKANLPYIFTNKFLLDMATFCILNICIVLCFSAVHVLEPDKETSDDRGSASTLDLLDSSESASGLGGGWQCIALVLLFPPGSVPVGVDWQERRDTQPTVPALWGAPGLSFHLFNICMRLLGEISICWWYPVLYLHPRPPEEYCGCPVPVPRGCRDLDEVQCVSTQPKQKWVALDIWAFWWQGSSISGGMGQSRNCPRQTRCTIWESSWTHRSCWKTRWQPWLEGSSGYALFAPIPGLRVFDHSHSCSCDFSSGLLQHTLHGVALKKIFESFSQHKL